MFFFCILSELITKCHVKRENTLFSHNFSLKVAQKAEKTLFSCILCELCTKYHEKREETLFSYTFCGTSCDKLKKRCCLHFMWSVSKTVKKHCFSHLFQNAVQKAQIKAVSLHFMRNHRKREKIMFSHTFSWRSRKKPKKCCFLAF